MKGGERKRSGAKLKQENSHLKEKLRGYEDTIERNDLWGLYVVHSVGRSSQFVEIAVRQGKVIVRIP